jgi:hypothetical protein
MYTGLTVALDLERQTGGLVAGFSFWPLGWLMTIGAGTVPGAADVSRWTEIEYDNKSAVTRMLPCQWALSPYPGDFRGPEELSAVERWTTRPT